MLLPPSFYNAKHVFRRRYQLQRPGYRREFGTLADQGWTDPGCETGLLVTDSIQVDSVAEPGAPVILGAVFAGLGLLCCCRCGGRRRVGAPVRPTGQSPRIK